MDELLGVKFTHSNTVHERRPYTIYEIEVRSSSTITWVIYKRYSSFDELHEQLQKFITSNIAVFGPIKLPILPPKRLTRSLAAEFVEKRKTELQDYLRSCLQIPTLLHSDVMLNFLEVPDSVRPMLSRPNPSQQNKSSNNNDPNKSSSTTTTTNTNVDGTRFGQHTPEEKQVLELIQSLKSSQNKVAAIRRFETWFFQSQGSTTRTRLSAEYIRLLFEGQPEAPISTPQPPIRVGQTLQPQQPIQQIPPSIGLVYVCGDFRHSRCAARAALYLICRLCDPERNKDSSIYIDQFASLPSSLLQRLRLHNHIFSSRGNRPAAFSIIHVLQQYVETRFSNGNSGNANNNQNEITLEFLVQEAWARQEYLKWLRVKNTQHFRTTQFTHEHNTNLSLLLRGNTLAAYRPLIQSGFQQLLEVCALETGWHEVELDPPQTPGGQNPNNPNGTSNTNNPHGSNHMTSHNNPNSPHSILHNNNNNNRPVPPVPPSPMNRPQQTLRPAGSSLHNHNTTTNPSTPRNQQGGANTTTNDDTPKLPISLSYQRDVENNLVLLRSCVLVPFSVQEVNSIISVPDLLPLWDTKVHSANVTQQFDPSSDILHLVYYTNWSFYHQKDFSLLRSVTQLSDGSVILLYRSVNIPSCGEVKGYHRCVLAPSGYVISPISPQETLITLLLQLDDDSVLLYASDLLGESQDVKTSWHNLVALLEENR